MLRLPFYVLLLSFNHLWCVIESKEVHKDHLPDYFLLEIFNKYGDDNNMSFEGFEHLLDNLGLGGGVFEDPHDLSIHRINGTFSEIHDAAHRHKRHSHYASDKLNITKCLSPSAIMEAYGLEPRPGIYINSNQFLHVCPALVYQLDQRSCIKMERIVNKPVEAHIAWIYATISVLIISATGLLGVAVMPIIHSKIFSQLLHFLVALAIGTLAGDAMLHLLPHALTDGHHSHGGGESNTVIFKLSLTLFTILMFYGIESILTLYTGGKGLHTHSHSHKPHSKENIHLDTFEMNVMLPDIEKKNNKTTPVSFMIIIGDALHNVTDGLAIGAAFSNDIITGLATALAVLCHELPHELGDFAVLLKSGMSLKKALGYNVLSSVLSFAGMAGGLWLAEDHESASQWIYAATAGTFIYIAFVDLIPEINGGGNKTMSEFILAFLGILLGYIIMLSIALYEESMLKLFNY